MASTELPKKVLPAQVGFLAIYNPSLGVTDETIDDQIVYFSSPESRNHRRHRNRNSGKSVETTSKDEKNEQLRQIGLAQGMVEFGRTFSDGTNVNTVETEKSRIILHELEPGWWILASIELTRLPTTKTSNDDSRMKGDTIEDGIEYSSREVKPAFLLLQDLLRAHSTFLLHHAASMSALFVRTKRQKFLGILMRYWDAYISTWSVLMHGNPAINIYGGIKVAACGELGIGVGEEDRGSGEREVLEGFVGRVEGLVDLVVSRFGESEEGNKTPKGILKTEKQSEPWLGSGEEPAMEDGAIFLGIGALSRRSLRDVTNWMEDLYTWGPDAYGVTENPSSMRRPRKRKPSKREHKGTFQETAAENAQDNAREVYGINDISKTGSTKPRTENGQAEPSSKLKRLSKSSTWRKSGSQERSNDRRPTLRSLNSGSSNGSKASRESSQGVRQSRIVSFMKLGYGTHWTLGGGGTAKTQSSRVPEDGESRAEALSPSSELPTSPLGQADPSSIKVNDDSIGHYLIGLLGDVEQDDNDDIESDSAFNGSVEGDHNRRTLLRTLTVELEREGDARAEADISVDLFTQGTSEISSKRGGSKHSAGGASQGSFEGRDRNKTKKLQIVVYVNKPFIFTFLFEQRTPSLALATLYRSLHHQLSPLQKALMNSTTYRSSRPEITTTSPTDDTAAPIYDLIWDSKLLTISCTLPSIPTAAQVASLGPQGLLPWSRVEAINTHSQILNTFISTRNEMKEIERTCKTSRGYWVVWNRIPGSEDHNQAGSQTPSPDPTSPALCSEGSQTPSQRQTQRSPENTVSPEEGSLNPSTRSAAHPFLDVGGQTSPPKQNHKEIFLVRKAGSYVSGRSHRRLASGSGESGWGDSSVKLTQGIGVDTKRYIEGLLHLT